MAKNFTLEYWLDDDWYVGMLKEVPGAFSQGETREELEENIRGAYRLMIEDMPVVSYLTSQSKLGGFPIRTVCNVVRLLKKQRVG